MKEKPDHPKAEQTGFKDEKELYDIKVQTARSVERLGVSLTDFTKLIESKKIYVDKTEKIYNLLNDNTNCILITRPRRFGKTLLLSTIQAILQGRKELFGNLFIGKMDPEYPFVSSHVIRLSMGPAGSEPDDYIGRMKNYLDNVASRYNITLKAEKIGDSIYELIQSLYYSYDSVPLAKIGPLAHRTAEIPEVSVLIDEYDYQLISNLHDKHKLEATFHFLDDFYTGIKTAADEIRYLIVTGITKFKGMLHSGFNIVKDKTLNPNYAAICGFTKDEIIDNYSENIKASLANRKLQGITNSKGTEEELISSIIDWYDGYTWDGVTRIFNPCSLLDFFSTHELAPYWSDTADSRVVNECLKLSKDYFYIFYRNNYFEESSKPDDLAEISPATVLFQTGYLTIKSISRSGGQHGGDKNTKTYQLSIPNREVRQQFAQKIIIPQFLKINPGISKNRQPDRFNDFCRYFSSRSVVNSQISLASIFSSYSYKLHISLESYYKTIILTALCFSDGEVTAEMSVGGGDIDLFLELASDIMVIEVKYSHAPGSSTKEPGKCSGKQTEKQGNKRDKAKQIRDLLEAGIIKAFCQINDKGYAKKFLNKSQNKNVWLVAISIVGRNDIRIRFKKAK